MCLINFQFQQHPQYKLILIANRDEEYSRPTEPAHFWKDEPDLLAGRDLRHMGTWLGITRSGRFSAITNFRTRTFPAATDAKISRGRIVQNYLTGLLPPEEFLKQLRQNRSKYEGFNLLAGDQNVIFHYNNNFDEITKIPAGIHGLSNATLNTPWPKLKGSKNDFAKQVVQEAPLDPESLFLIFSDQTEAPDQSLPQTGLPIELERVLSSRFIQTDDYGTVSSTILLIDQQDQATFIERRFDRQGVAGETSYTFAITPDPFNN